MADFLNPCHLGDVIIRQSVTECTLCRVTAVGKGLQWSHLITVADLEVATALAIRFADAYKARAWIETPDHTYMELKVNSHHT